MAPGRDLEGAIMTIDEMIAVLQAANDGKKIQIRWKDELTDNWQDVSCSPYWDFRILDYRVKPELI